MTKSEAKKVLTGILRSPIDFIYLFATDSFINALSGVYRRTVYTKNRLQYQYVNRAALDAGESFTDWREQIRTAIQNTYDLTPYEILNRLAAGKDVAGKNWAKGVYGIGATRYEGFSQNASITVDNATGKLMQNGTEIAGQTAVYSGSGKVVGYTVELEGARYQSQKSGSKFYAGSYSTSEGAWNADGSTFQAVNSQSVFQNLFAYLPEMTKFLEWIFSLFKVTPVATTNVVASQTDWVKDKKSTTTETLLYFVAGAGLVALLFGRK